MLVNRQTDFILASRVLEARTFWQRLCGLLPYESLQGGEGMLISPCRSVHTFFMRFDIDVLYLSRDLKVLFLYENVVPGKTLPYSRDTWCVLELPAGTIAATDTRIGHQLVKK